MDIGDGSGVLTVVGSGEAVFQFHSCLRKLLDCIRNLGNLLAGKFSTLMISRIANGLTETDLEKPFVGVTCQPSNYEAHCGDHNQGHEKRHAGRNSLPSQSRTENTKCGLLLVDCALSTNLDTLAVLANKYMVIVDRLLVHSRTMGTLFAGSDIVRMIIFWHFL